MRRSTLATTVALLLCGAPGHASSAAFENTWGVVLSFAPSPAFSLRCIWTLSGAPEVSLSGTCADSSTMSASGIQFPDPDSFQLEGNTPNVVFIQGSANPEGTLISGFLGFAGGSELSFVGRLCGNDVLDAGEQCDGGLTPPACCDTTTCTLLPDGASCDDSQCAPGSCQGGTCTPIAEPAGTPCEHDGNNCTRDACDGTGSCVTTACSPCCDAGAGCSAPDVLTCINSIDRTTRIKLRTAPDGKVQVRWNSQHLATTTAADLGTPTVAGDYQLCVYDGLPPRRLVLDATLPAASTCGSRPCWRQSVTGVTYRSSSRAPDGIALLSIRPGPSSKGSLVVTGKGPALLTHTPPSDPPAPFAWPVTVALHNDAACWATTFGDGTTVVQRNAPGDYVARRGQ